MSHRFALVIVVLLVAVALAPAEPGAASTKAVPPDKAVLDRLNLKTEWTQFIPVAGNRDTITQVQTLDDQIFVQTRTGTFVALDAATGKVQWMARLGNGSYGNSYPCTANAQFVFVAHVTKLYAFYRYTGATEFVAELGTPPTVGLTCDTSAVYCVLGMRPGTAGAHRVAVYNLPNAIVINDPIKGPIDKLAQGAKDTASSPVDDLLKRYNPGAINPTPPPPMEASPRPRVLETPVGGMTGSRTPSLYALPSVVPPYNLEHRAPSPSLGTLPSFVAPYRLYSDAGKYVQQTPSLGVIPPSVAASLLLSDLRPKSIEPPLRWEYGLTTSVLYQPNLTPTRVWTVLEGGTALALTKVGDVGKVTTEVTERLTSAISARPSQAGTMQYFPLGNGTVLAVDAASGNLAGGLSVKWRADTGGINNHSPFVTKGFVYSSGDDSGVACVNRDTGAVVWRSDKSADTVIGANEEFVYVRDRQGRFLVFDAKRATDPARKKSAPLGSANLSEFAINVVNTANDRVYLAADNGLIVCVRDAAPKYARPVRVWPAPDVNPPKKAGIELQPGKDGMDPKKDPDPKKEPDKKP
ncbi:MAG: hypothetical protein FJ304_03585 [Planctomycetes bacterium]|nr:hypothetical protein [Planctomycetota bacterium]